LKEKNTVAVRVIDGPRFGEPIAYWSVLPDPPATEQRYTRDPAKSIPGHKKGSQHLGSGFGIHREVYLETTDATCITAVFARGDPATGKATVQVETDSTEKWEGTMRVEISAENFWLPPMKQDSNESVYYEAEVPCKIPQGQGKHAISIPMPAAYLWSPATPYLYRCRVKIHNPAQQAPKDSNGGNPWLGPAKVRVDPPWVDAQDVLFGFRSFGIVSKANPRPGLLEGMFLLNGRPVFLRGANVSPALNLLWYWGQREKLIDAILMLKAANYNAVRVCQHVHFPEVRELLDRLGMMSEQDQGGGRNGDTPAARAELAAAGTALARACYNNPGVVLLSLGNEAHLDVTPVVAAVLAADPQRVLKPISGNGHPKGPVGYSFPAAYWNNVVDDFHFYRGWYGDEGRIWKLSQRRAPDRLVTVGEFGAEGLDAYETMSRHYPAHFGPAPPITADALWGEIQVKKADARQIWGFRGKRPANLGQYIEASQNYQADMLAEIAQGFRLSPRRIGGYFQFHFLDALPAHWPKAVVSHDFTPKRAYFAMAQVNQPLVPLFQLTEKGQSMEIWVANDLPGRLPGCRVVWTVEVCGSKQVIGGQMAVDVPGADAVLAGKVDLKALPPEADVVTVNLVLSDAAGKELSPYRREVLLKGWRLENAVFAEAKR
jgi:hypothetical protein